ncbi:hypothetical protein F5Y17DRAFT_474326 [Xylariaceae sp. FL0594]|nr:hypothetical protein F5Y17DRAFT_474326 [Xylariaceae sp. FL0594]
MANLQDREEQYFAATLWGLRSLLSLTASVVLRLPFLQLGSSNTLYTRSIPTLLNHGLDLLAVDSDHTLGDGPQRTRVQKFLVSTDWIELQQYAARRRDGMSCQVLPDIGLGYNHVVRIIEFADGFRWVARLQMPSLGTHTPGTNTDADADGNLVISQFESRMRSEAVIIGLVRERTDIPTPKIHAMETRGDGPVKASFMLVECLPGNVGMDLGMDIPERFKSSFLKQLATIHVSLLSKLSTVKLPKIGEIIARNTDGTYEQGPIPGLGGPFDTATEYFQAWASKTKFGAPPEQLRLACGPYADEIVPAVASFPKSIMNFTHAISTCDNGPFPLCHGDFGHNNIVVDDEYRVLGVIDWEMAYAGPWEMFADFPLTLRDIPPAIDAPWNYDEAGNPKDEETRQLNADCEEYIAAVREKETELGIDCSLSDVLADQKRG